MRRRRALLLWNFRSLVIPATAIALNLLSVGAAYGVLVSVFQGGWGLVHVPGVHHGPIAAAPSPGSFGKRGRTRYLSTSSTAVSACRQSEQVSSWLSRLNA